jgi:hypothetical protein
MPRSGTAEERLRSVELDLDNGLSFARHFNSESFDLEVTGASYDVDKVLTKLRGEPEHVVVTRVRNLDNPDLPGNMAGTVSWDHAPPIGGRRVLRIQNFPGLDPSTRYSVRFLVFGNG